MRFFFLFFNYLVWHYSTAVSDLYVNLKNLLGFIVDFFSLPDLVKTLFDPWKRMGEEYPDHFDFELFMTALIVNALMRVVGVIMRLIVLIIGLVVLLISFVLAFGFFVTWFVLPVIVFGLIVTGLFYLVS